MKWKQNDIWVIAKMNEGKIDTTFDVRVDSNGMDPDKYSNTLKKYHQKLWSKKLPNGKMFYLDDAFEKTYLYHNSELGEFNLASDSIDI